SWSRIHNAVSFLLIPHPPCSCLFPYTTLFRSFTTLVAQELYSAAFTLRIGVTRGDDQVHAELLDYRLDALHDAAIEGTGDLVDQDRKSTRLNSSHVKISYAVFCLKKKKHARTL